MLPKVRLAYADMWKGFHIESCTVLRLLRQRFDVELSDDPEFLIYSVYGDEHLRYRCIRILLSAENVRPDWDECDFAFTFDLAEHPDHFRWPNFARHDDCNKLIKYSPDVEQILASKSKFCNFIYSNRKCRMRNQFFDLLSRYKRVDAGGRVRNNLGYRVANKREFIIPYKFTIAFENESHPGYTTEKIAHPMWANSLPIYWGNPLIHLDFNPQSFISFYDYGSLPALVERVVEVDRNDDLYAEYLRQPWFPGNQVPLCAQTELVLDRFAEIFATDRVPVAIRRPRRPLWKPWQPVKNLVRSWLRAA